jgi:hypothetical protein
MTQSRLMPCGEHLDGTNPELDVVCVLPKGHAGAHSDSLPEPEENEEIAFEFASLEERAQWDAVVAAALVGMSCGGDLAVAIADETIMARRARSRKLR